MAIRSIIEAQMQAFQHDDGEAAFSFAAPVIRERFGTAENFMAMVREGYRPVYRPRDVRFGALASIGGQLAQRVALVGPDGVPVTAVYLMEQQPDGTWRIAGCYLLVSEDKTT